MRSSSTVYWLTSCLFHERLHLHTLLIDYPRPQPSPAPAAVPEKISSATRSRMMAGIRGANTKPEMQIRSGLHAAGFRFRLHARGLPGKPDVVLPKWKVAVFVHGCFWHGHAGCAYFQLPKTRIGFWTDKIAANAARDTRAIDALRAAGWRVAVVWECALRSAPEQAIEELAQFIRSDRVEIEIAKPQ